MERQVYRLPPDLVEGILSGVHDRCRDDPQPTWSPSPSSAGGRRKSLTDDLLELSGDPHASGSPGLPRVTVPGTGRLKLSDGHHAHYLGLEMLLPSTELPPSSPLERFWDEPHRHEEIAFMMHQFNGRPSPSQPHVPHPLRQDHPAPLASFSGHHAPRIKPATAEQLHPAPKAPVQGGDVYDVYDDDDDDDDQRTRPRSKLSKSPSPGFCPGLEVDGDADGDLTDVPDLEAIRIAARIKTEQIYRRGQRECRLGRIRKKIGRVKRTRDVEPS